MRYVHSALIGYALGYTVSYAFIMEGDFSFFLTYLGLAWSGGLEQPTFIQYCALSITLLTVLGTWIYDRLFGTGKLNRDRLKVVNALLEFSEPTDRLSEHLEQFKWDYEGKTAVLKIDHIKKALTRFLAGELSASEIEKWADLIECRDDIEFEDDHSKELIQDLSNPDLSGALNSERAETLLSMDSV